MWFGKDSMLSWMGRCFLDLLELKGLEGEFRTRLYSAASGLNVRQKHIMKNIRSFRPGKVYRYSLHAGQKLKEALAQIRRAGRR